MNKSKLKFGGLVGGVAVVAVAVSAFGLASSGSEVVPDPVVDPDLKVVECNGNDRAIGTKLVGKTHSFDIIASASDDESTRGESYRGIFLTDLEVEKAVDGFCLNGVFQLPAKRSSNQPIKQQPGERTVNPTYALTR